MPQLEKVTSDMRIRARSDLTFHCLNEETLHLAVQNALSEDSDQTARMRRLIGIFAGRTCLRYFLYGHSLPSADSRRAVVSFRRKNVHNTG